MEQQKNTTLFLDIIAGKIPNDCIYQDDLIYAFMDIHPANPGHVLVIPKKHSENLLDIDDDTLSRVIVGCKRIAQAVLDVTGAKGFNLIQNNNAIAGQVVFHTHFHIIPRYEGDGHEHWHGRPEYKDSISEIANKLRDVLA